MSTTSMTSPRAPQMPLSRFANLQTADRLLCGVLIALSLFALALGIAYGVAMALVRSGLLAPAPDTGYRVLTLHGTTAFFYWLYTAQAATVLLLAAAEKKGALALRGLAWAGTALIAASFVLSELAAIAGTPLLYEANPELGTDDPRTVAGMTGGYLLLAAGFCADRAQQHRHRSGDAAAGRRRTVRARLRASGLGRIPDRERDRRGQCVPARPALGVGIRRIPARGDHRLAHPVPQPALPAADGDGARLVCAGAGSDRDFSGHRDGVLQDRLRVLSRVCPADLALSHVPRTGPAGERTGGGLAAVALRQRADADRVPDRRRVAGDPYARRRRRRHARVACGGCRGTTRRWRIWASPFSPC
ncbi:MAG: cbb3-type cytochrome c oxidase subunit I [Pseudorhodoplanes sp.]|nr:cbb3-type cytochrome c oxidase subunit I [Pseudorhodoplanes sp.]